MKKLKKQTKRSRVRVKRTVKRYRTTDFYGIEHEFIIIAGGGFLVMVLAIILFFR